MSANKDTGMVMDSFAVKKILLTGYQDTCPRCGGLLVQSYSNALEEEGGETLLMSRCINCGELLERQILVNRQIDSTSSKPRKAPPRLPAFLRTRS